MQGTEMTSRQNGSRKYFRTWGCQNPLEWNYSVLEILHVQTCVTLVRDQMFTLVSDVDSQVLSHEWDLVWVGFAVQHNLSVWDRHCPGLNKYYLRALTQAWGSHFWIS